MSILDKIVWKPLASDQYCREETFKNTIYVHHTAGNSNPYSVLRWWAEEPSPVATSFVIGGDGTLVQAFSSKYWAYHLGLKKSNMPPGSESSRVLNNQAIGIEICNWGWLKYNDGKFYTYVNSTIPEEDVIVLTTPYRNYKYWHKYTDAQLKVCAELIQFLAGKFNIPMCYKGDQMFELDIRAFKGEPGIWTHTSVRQDKTDCSPQPNLIKMLKGVGGTND